ncbi:hypothetical protein GOP47_0012991 [Adiantum capillus-veneris]|uniref:Acyl-coenzyme A thioesterase 13 n=1 Tax=Adiantum capillus-veneris TaxID=13818 RepID=A0A9D4URR1_ADICA|nr:hypothetical protein GOP47_0012991 [Adiantum capillus-veneris]
MTSQSLLPMSATRSSANQEGLWSSPSPPPSSSVEEWFRQLSGNFQESITSIPQFHEGITLKPLKVEVTEPGRFVCSFRVPTHLTNSLQVLHQGVISSLVDNVGAAALVTVDGRVRVSVDLNVSYTSSAHIDDEIEVDAMVSKYTTSIGVVIVKLTNKRTGELVAEGRHTMYFPASKL